MSLSLSNRRCKHLMLNHIVLVHVHAPEVLKGGWVSSTIGFVQQSIALINIPCKLQTIYNHSREHVQYKENISYHISGVYLLTVCVILMHWTTAWGWVILMHWAFARIGLRWSFILMHGAFTGIILWRSFILMHRAFTGVSLCAAPRL